MEYIWELKDEGREIYVNQISEMLNINNSLSSLLVQRGIKTFEDAKKFFRPELTQLYDPFLMLGMKEAVERIEIAIERSEKILIYGDYDVDGTTSVALVYSFLKNRYSKLGFYIPDRYSEGYGISTKGIEYASDNGFPLIIALDCGIKAIEKVEYAKSKNIDFIICDHHTPGLEIPKAVAVLDPKQPNCNYPFKELSACGVGFKLIQAFSRRNLPDKLSSDNQFDINVQLYDELVCYLDLVVVSIAADIVPIVDENRILAYFGLKQLNNHPRAGLKALIQASGASIKQLNISDCVFKIGPRINAAGRIKSGEKAVELLITDDEDLATTIGLEINTYNNIRKDFDQLITKEALDLIKSNDELISKKTTVLFKKEWHKGVIGIVASRLIESFYRPTVILTESHGLATGSARSVVGFNLYTAICECSDLLEAYGGHKYAAGLTLKLENVPLFTDKFEKVVSASIGNEQLIPRIEVDAKLKFRDINPKFYRILKQFAPYGPENMTPVFVTENVCDTGNSRIIGNSKEHLRMEIFSEGVAISGIAFGMANYYDLIKKGKRFDVCYTVEENEFKGNISLQLMIKDIKVKK